MTNSGASASRLIALAPPTADRSTGGAPELPIESPADWLLAASARRELTDRPITANPVVGLTNGVVTGSINATSQRNPLLTHTVLATPSAGGKLTLDAMGNFTFLPDGTIVATRGTERFSVLVTEKTPLIVALERTPFANAVVQPVVAVLRQIPVVGALLQPIIGYSMAVSVSVDVAALVPAGTPIAFTTRVTSFDGTPISTNFFPAVGLLSGMTAPTVLLGPGFADPGETNPNSSWSTQYGVPGLAPLRADGYNVVTWDPRGVQASGGVLHLNNPMFEGRDAQAIIDWVATRPEARLDGVGDPRMGMVGGSYGGGIQLVTAAIDRRVDAIVPGITWNSLLDSLYPNGAFKTAYSLLLSLDLLTSGTRAIPDIFAGVITGTLLGVLTPGQQATLSSSGPGLLVSDITAPTLLFQGTVDPLFPLQQAVANAQLLDANGVPVKMVWFCGGHGACLTSVNDGALIADRTMAWLDRYVRGNAVDTGPQFEWVNQHGQWFSSDALPSDSAFYGTPMVTSGAEGVLPLQSFGGSGPQDIVPPPLSLALASKASTAVDLVVSGGDTTTQLVGAPQLTFTYSGIGTSRFVYAQIVDDQTGLVLGNLVTPIPVTLDGGTHTVTIPLEQIAHTLAPGETLTLQITGSSVAYANLSTSGVMNVSAVSVALPTAAVTAAGSVPFAQLVA
ncbi:CocE/NonD family hydrolase [Mycolicibacterium sp. GCM10028919]|uniref:S15 peptidase family protein n=1 Tax=Mycolicibacterium sp. GCM10028919 TaxID=3273401 RepID=UPI0036073A35